MFIVFEGGEGVGKSTQIELIYNALRNKNLPCLKTREPGGTPFAEKIRNLFKEKSNDSPTTLTELYLICAARAQHIEKVVRPGLAENKIILCDRFLDSTYVYQHFLGKIPKETIDGPTSTILRGLIPNLTFIFNCDKNISEIRRKEEKNRHLDRLDSLDIDSHKKILEGYKKLFHDELAYPCGKIPKRINIEASLSIEEVFSQIKNSLKNSLNIEL